MKENKNKDLKDVYEKVYSSGKENFFTVSSLAESIAVHEQISNWQNLEVLEIGCGTGKLSHMIAASGAKNVIACDYSQSAIDIAISENSNLANLNFICCDVFDLKMNKKFDVIVLQGVLEHIDNPFLFLQKINNSLLKKSGTILCSCPAFHNPRGYIWMTLQILFNVPMSLTDIHFFSIDDFKRFAIKNNMDINWKSIHHEWGSGDILLLDYKKRLINALRDANMSNEKVTNLLAWIKISNKYFTNTNDTGATIVYSLKNKL